MAEVLIRGAVAVVTMNTRREEMAGADVLIRDGVIAGIGMGLITTGRVVEAAGCVVTPGLVNTHHHLLDPDAGRAGGTGRAAVWLVEDAFSDLGTVRA